MVISSKTVVGFFLSQRKKKTMGRNDLAIVPWVNYEARAREPVLYGETLEPLLHDSFEVVFYDHLPRRRSPYTMSSREIDEFHRVGCDVDCDGRRRQSRNMLSLIRRYMNSDLYYQSRGVSRNTSGSG